MAYISEMAQDRTKVTIMN